MKLIFPLAKEQYYSNQSSMMSTVLGNYVSKLTLIYVFMLKYKYIVPDKYLLIFIYKYLFDFNLTILSLTINLKFHEFQIFLQKKCFFSNMYILCTCIIINFLKHKYIFQIGDNSLLGQNCWALGCRDEGITTAVNRT